MPRDPDEILNLKEFAEATGLDPRPVRRIAAELGGKRSGRLWLFRWGTAMEFFSNANTDKIEARQCMAGKSLCERQADRQPTIPARKKGRPGMAGGKRVGGGTEAAISCECDDPFGLRAAYAMGKNVS